jgi:uncharacterized phage protein (TIGR02220 family)
MGKDPAFLFYPNDYIGGTMGMTFEEKGAYIELLMLQFNRGHMTTHMIGQTVGQLWVKLQDKFIVDDNGLMYNRRLEQEINKRKNYVESRNNNRSGENQYTKNKVKKSGHMTTHTTPHMENENENENRIDNESVNLNFSDIVSYLNEKAGTSFKASSSKTRDLINARFNEKFTLDDFKKVIDIKCSEWIGGEYEKFLRPETLFSNKFEGYLNQKSKNSSEQSKVINGRMEL